MKKFVLFFAMIIAFVGAFAQNCEQSNYVGQSRFFDNTSIGIEGGVQTNLYDWNNPQGGIFGINLNKQLIPQFGISLEGYAGFNNIGNWYSTDGSHHYHNGLGVDNVQVYLSGRWNLMNTFASYNGKPRVFEIETNIGVGYGHFFYKDGFTSGVVYQPVSENVMLGKTGINLNFNLGKEKAWTISLRPTVVWNLTDVWGNNALQSDAAVFQITAGVEYHFGTSNGKHYAKNANLYDCSEFESLNSRINCLLADIKGLEEENIALQQDLENCMNRPVETVAQAVPVYILPNIQFLFNSAQISDTSISSLYEIGEMIIANPEINWVLTGYASNEGAEQYNLELSHQRAAAVYNHLVNYGVNPEQLTVVAGGITEEYPEPCLNRIVTVTQTVKSYD